MDRYILDSTRLNAEAARLRDFLAGDPGAILIIEFYADRAEDLPPRLDALEADLRGRAIRLSLSSRRRRRPRRAASGSCGKLALGLSMAEKGDAKAISFVEDTAVAAGASARLHRRVPGRSSRRHGTTAGVYAHASVGCLHVRPVDQPEDGRRASANSRPSPREVAELVLKYGGALSGEHGDGLVRSPFQEKMFGPVSTRRSAS